jgi:hypothetical protein
LRSPALLAVMALACAAHAPAAVDPEPAAEVTDSGPDAQCLQWLRERALTFVEVPRLEDVRTPIEVRGPLGAIELAPRAGRSAQMDCGLARALVEAGPLFEELGVRKLFFSGASDHRTRRDSTRLSEHAHGLAIDVHVLGTTAGDLDVARDFEAGAGSWRNLVPGQGALEACVGEPRTPRGRALRTLVCRLKLHSAFRVIVTPDDDDDHRDHIHLETFGDTLARVRRIVGVLPLRKAAARSR